MEETSRMHPQPLDNFVVLKKIFSFLPLDELKTARRVCKSWASIAKKELLKKSVFHFTTENAETFLTNSEDNAISKLQSMVYGNTNNTINLSLTMERYYLTEPDTEQHHPKTISYGTAVKLLLHLAEKGTSIDKLILEFCPVLFNIIQMWKLLAKVAHLPNKIEINRKCSCISWRKKEGDLDESEEQAEDIANNQMFALMGNDEADGMDEELNLRKDLAFPNLKSLTGNFMSFPTKENLDQTILRQLIRRSLYIEVIDCESGTGHREISATADRPEILGKLRVLRSVILNEEDLLALQNKRLKLQSLSFELHSGFRVPALNTFLSSVGETLTKLDINFVRYPNAPEQFKCGEDLVNLTDLTMRHFYGSVHFVRFMKKLKSLTLRTVNLSVALSDEAEFHDYQSKLESLQVYNGIGSNGRFMLPTVYRDIVKFFPYLKALRLGHLTDSSLRTIANGLDQLEELDIPNGIYTDDTLKDTIVQLEKLQSLKLHSPKITDAGVIEGVLQYKGLRKLSINSPLISETSLFSICESPYLDTIEFVNCYRLTNNAPRKITESYGAITKDFSFVFK